jgi:hypothetical protein
MTSRLQFELFMREMRAQVAGKRPTQLPPANNLHPAETEDVGAVRLSRIEAAMKETRAARAGK